MFFFGVRLSEHQAEVKKATNKKYTRSEPFRASELEQSKSAISDHVARANHVIDWDEAKILGREHDKKSREVREAIEITRRGAKTLNREEGTYLLSHVYDPLIKKSRTVKETISRRLLITSQSGSDGHSDEVSRQSEGVLAHIYIFDWISKQTWWIYSRRFLCILIIT